jgi:aminopeptidase N
MPHVDRWLEQAWFTHAPRSRPTGTPPRFDETTLPEHYPPHLELEPTHILIDLYVSVSARSVGGRATTTVRAARAGDHTLILDAVDFEDVAVHDLEDRTLVWQYDGRKLTITWEQPFAAQDVRRVEVAYRTVSPTAGLYFAGPDSVYPQQPAYMISDHETERARHWLPCIDLPNVRTALDIHLRANARYTILANGYLVATTDHGDGTKTAHWRLEQPCPSYLICIAVGEFTAADDGVFMDGARAIPVAFYAGAEHRAEDILRTFAPTKAMLGWMTQLLDLPFPYPKYYQIAVAATTGAMENISLVAWTDIVIQDAALAAEYAWRVDQVNVHEMAHSYFGDAVVCRDFAHAWLKESWATYIEYCWQADSAGRDAADYVYYLHRSEYLDEANNAYQRPIITRRFQSSWDLYDCHLYEGGACRLHTLRAELGDDTFWAAVRDYLKRYQHQVVETDDFRRVLEEHSGRSLGKFFDQWFHTPAFPDLKVTFDYDQTRHEGTFTIEQKQVNTDKGIPAFVFNTAVSWVIGSKEYRHPIHVTGPRAVVVVPMSDKPEQVRFDPDHAVLHQLEFNPGDPMLRRQLVAAPDIIGRIEAAKTLAKSNKHTNIAAIVQAFHQEHFWGVRCELATLLGDTNHATAIVGLAELIESETEPRVLVSLLRAAANHRDPQLATAIRARLTRGVGPLATQAAYLALGNQRDQAPYDLLTQAAARVTPDGRAQAGAFHALAATRHADAIPLLRRYAAYGGSPNRARPAATAALGALIKSQPDPARPPLVEQLTDLLRDPWRQVRWAAAAALAAAGQPTAIPALEAFAQPLSVQEQAAAARLIADLRPSDKLDGSALTKQMDDLRAKVRDLEHQLQTLAARLDANPDDDN